MVQRGVSILWLALVVAVLPVTAYADAEIGKPAPEFSGTGSDGKTHTLAEYRGRILVIEWLNHDCPYVRKHYDTRNMQSLQKELTDQGVAWLSVISSAPGKQGHSSAAKANADAKEKDAHATAILLDESGEIGRAYGAKTTPTMFVVGADGTLIYKGAIDDRPTFAKDTISGAKNYVRQAVNETREGKQVSEPATAAYGCSVKY
jgi:peroxiredoxin